MAGILKVDRVQSDSNLAFQIGSSNVAYFNTTGMNLSGGEIIAGGSTLRTTSGMIYANNGIAFPATAVSSSDPNTLDDYEEGTWTPTFLGSTTNPTVTYSTQRGVYTKIGNTVHCNWQIVFSGLSGGSGYGMIGGFPFTSAAGSSTQPGYTAGCITESPAALSFGSGRTQIAHELTGNDTRAYFTFLGSAVDQSVKDVTTFTGNHYYVGSLTYRVA